MAEGHVHVVLTEGLGQTTSNVVEFVIGGWDLDRTVIRTYIYGNRGGAIQAQAHTPGIVSKTEYHEFWVGWINGSMEVGCTRLSCDE